MARFLIYFENAKGDIWLPPTDDTPTPKDFIRKECNSLTDVDHIYKRMQLDFKIMNELTAEREERVWRDPRARVRENLIARMHSAGVGEYERDFIYHYLMLSDERKKEHHRQRFEHRQLFLEMREMDKPRNPEEVLGESL